MRPEGPRRSPPATVRTHLLVGIRYRIPTVKSAVVIKCFRRVLVKARSISAINSNPVRHAIHARLHRNVVTHASSRVLQTALSAAERDITYIASHLHRHHFNNTVQTLDRLPLVPCHHHHRHHPLPLSLPSPTRRRLSLTPDAKPSPAHGNWSSSPPTQPSPPATLIGICCSQTAYHLQTASHEHVPGTKDASCAPHPEIRSRGSVVSQREMIHREN
jgi:hypothetical protein